MTIQTVGRTVGRSGGRENDRTDLVERARSSETGILRECGRLGGQLCERSGKRMRCGASEPAGGLKVEPAGERLYARVGFRTTRWAGLWSGGWEMDVRVVV